MPDEGETHERRDDRARGGGHEAGVRRARVSAVRPAARRDDWNGDHDVDRTLFPPKKGAGFSDDAPTSVGPPAGGRMMPMRRR